MLDKPRSSRKSRVEWPTVFLVILCYGLWAFAGLFIWPAYPVFALLLMGVAVALHSSITHEVLHGHPTRNALLNEACVFLPIGLVWPYRRFKTLHLRHHADERLTDPMDDPESYYQALWRHEAMPRWLKTLLRINNTMVGRFVLGPWLSSIGFVAGDVKLIASGDRAVAQAWSLHLAGLAIVVPIVIYGFGIPFWLYILVPAWLGQSMIAIRTFAEHQWDENPEGRTVIVERTPLSFLFLNNNLHFVHHASPTVAWYKLPRLFRERRDEWVRLNHGYVFPNYLAMLKAYAFRAKEPVAHPVLRATPECGGASAWLEKRRADQAGQSTSKIPAE
ncbi:MULTISPECIES: fatty acid desaturase [Mesorhizobium]|uniref:Fatty acid desaturase n=1 Tax=Mesorhizobium denitrificans TaxID=2294114 RepID=A0A371XFP9_9HYPH|nr:MULTISPECIES: fatty acid desaturase [Mesorhizobium]RFC68055.1 fatty acid desaturase [Mesorhizobium denitrificans]